MPGNPNPEIHENPNIAEAGKNTRFGAPGGPDPVEAGRKGGEGNSLHHSVRSELKYLAAQPLNFTEEEQEDDVKFAEALKKNFRRLRRKPNGEVTLARLGALGQFEEFVEKKSMTAATFVTENIEGKLSQELVIPDRKPIPEDMPTIEEATRVMKESFA